MPKFVSGDHLFITDKKCENHPDFNNVIIEDVQDIVILDRWESDGFIKVCVRILSSSDASQSSESESPSVS